MKQILITAMLAAPVIVAAQEDTYTLKGKFQSAQAAGKVYLTYYKDGTTKRDSATVQNGVFELKGPVDGPQQVYMTYVNKSASADKRSRNGDSRSMYVDKGTTFMNITDSIKTATIPGSVINADYARYEAVLKQAEAESSKLKKEYYALTSEQRKNAETVKALEERIDKAENAQEELMATYIKQNPDSYFSLLALQKVGGPYMNAAKVEPLFKKLSGRLQSSAAGQLMAANIAGAKATEVGNMAPNFGHKDVTGKMVKLSDYKGQYVLLDFWASWCGPCRAENPKVLKAYNAFKSKNFTVLGVSIDREDARDKWLKAIKDDGMPWMQLIDSDNTDKTSASNLYAIKAIPSNFLIDPNGKIIAKNLRGEALEKKLAEVIK